MATYNTAFGSLPSPETLTGGVSYASDDEDELRPRNRLQQYGAQQQTQQPQAQAPTFAQMQEQGQARPAPPQLQAPDIYDGVTSAPTPAPTPTPLPQMAAEALGLPTYTPTPAPSPVLVQSVAQTLGTTAPAPAPSNVSGTTMAPETSGPPPVPAGTRPAGPGVVETPLENIDQYKYTPDNPPPANAPNGATFLTENGTTWIKRGGMWTHEGGDLGSGYSRMTPASIMRLNGGAGGLMSDPISFMMQYGTPSTEAEWEAVAANSGYTVAQLKEYVNRRNTADGGIYRLPTQQDLVNQNEERQWLAANSLAVVPRGYVFVPSSQGGPTLRRRTFQENLGADGYSFLSESQYNDPRQTYLAYLNSPNKALLDTLGLAPPKPADYDSWIGKFGQTGANAPENTTGDPTGPILLSGSARGQDWYDPKTGKTYTTPWPEGQGGGFTGVNTLGGPPTLGGGPTTGNRPTGGGPTGGGPTGGGPTGGGGPTTGGGPVGGGGFPGGGFPGGSVNLGTLPAFAISAGTTDLQNQLRAILTQMQNAPSPFDSEAYRQQLAATEANLEAQYGAERSKLEEQLARQGLSASTFGAGRYGDLAGQQARALASMRAELLKEAANQMAERQQVLLQGMSNLSGQMSQQEIAAYNANLERYRTSGQLQLDAQRIQQDAYFRGQELTLQQARDEALARYQNRSLDVQQSEGKLERDLREALGLREITSRENVTGRQISAQLLSSLIPQLDLSNLSQDQIRSLFSGFGLNIPAGIPITPTPPTGNNPNNPSNPGNTGTPMNVITAPTDLSPFGEGQIFRLPDGTMLQKRNGVLINMLTGRVYDPRD